MPPRQAADEHQAGQSALVKLVPAAVAQAWTLLDPHNLSGTSPQLAAAVQAIVHHYGQASAAAAVQFYQTRRLNAGITGRPPALSVASPPPLDVVTRNVEWGISGLYGPVTDADVVAAQDKVSESATRLVLDQSRTTLMDAAAKDPAARGWARVVEPGGCSFCTMLALRAGAGSLYRSKESGGFQAHDNCRCHVEPVFGAYEPSHALRTAQAVWASSTKGLSGVDARNAFRASLAKSRA